MKLFGLEEKSSCCEWGNEQSDEKIENAGGSNGGSVTLENCAQRSLHKSLVTNYQADVPKKSNLFIFIPFTPHELQLITNECE